MHPIACEKVWAIVWACSGGLFVNIRNRMIFAYEGSPSLMLKQRESSIFQGKIPPKNMPRYKNLSEFSARNSGNMREKNGGDVWEAFTTRTSPSAPRKDALHGDRPLLYPAHLPPNSFAEFENDFIAYIDSEHVSLRLFSSKKPKPSLPLRKSLGKMWKTALNNIPPSSQNPSKSITCSVVTTPPKSRFYPFLSSTPMGKRIGKWIGGRVGQANAASWAQYMIKILSHR